MQHYGRREFHPNSDPTSELVQTILSQHTTDASSARAYEELRQRYPNWQAVAEAPIDELAHTIRFAGLRTQKARTIHAALSDFEPEELLSLKSFTVPEARARLTAIPGVGDKTASCVLLFALGMPAQPVDTHIERVTKRIGINSGESTATGIQHILEHCLPPTACGMFDFHIAMIRHGREVCHARSPRCEMCVVSSECDYFTRLRLRT